VQYRRRLLDLAEAPVLPILDMGNYDGLVLKQELRKTARQVTVAGTSGCRSESS
jgi:hypothetical protein